MIKVNDRLCQIVGYSKEELEGMAVSDITHPEDVGLAPEFFKRSISGEMESIVYEKRYIHGKGHVVWGEVSSSIVRGLEGEPLYFISHAQEVTQQKLAEEALKKSEEKFSKLFQASPVYTVVTTIEDGRFLEVNDAFMKITGYGREEVIGRTTAEVGLWANPEERIKFVKLAKERGRFRDQEVNFLKKNGEPLVMLWSAETINIDGIPCFISALADITELKKAQEELKESEEKFSKLFQLNPTYISLATLEEDRFVAVNDAFTRITGYEQSEVIGRTFRDIGLWPDPDDRDKFIREIERYGRHHLQDVTLKRKDGSLIHGLWSVEKIELEGKAHLISMLIDITKRKEAEEMLRVSQERFELFMDHFPGVVFMKDVKGHYIYVNNSYELSRGRKREDIFGKTDYDFWPAEIAAGFRKADEEVISQGRDLEIIEPVTYADGQIHTQLTRKFPVFKEGNPTFLAAIGIDITDMKRADDALRKSEEKFSKLFQTSPSYISLVTLKDGRFLDVNEAFTEVTGYQREDVIGLTSTEIGLFLDPEERVRSAKIAEEQGGFREHEIRLKRKNGELLIGLWSGEKIELGSEECLISVLIDITEKKQTLEKLQQSEQRFKEMADLLPSVICEMDSNLRITYANTLGLETLEYTQDDFDAGINAMDLLHPDYMEEAAKRIEQTTKGAKLGPMECTLFKKDGSEIPVLLNSAPIYKDGQLVGIRACLVDMTEQKELRRRLHHAQKMEAIGILAGGVAHDLNNILSGLVGYPELLLMDLPEESPLRTVILTIQRSGEKAAATVQDLLTLARTGIVVTEVVNLNDIISEYLSSPEYERLKSYHPGAQVETSLETDMLNILGSPVHLGKTVMNLVSNAAEAMPDGGKIIVSTETRYVDRPINGYEKVEEGDYVTLKVSDTGTGISSEDMEKIFEPFYTKKKMGRSGTGLGMTVVWGAVKDHKGYIDVKSTEGKGTSFILYFPATRKLAKDRPKIPIEEYMGQGEEILIVDDVEEQREIASGMLRTLRYKVTAVSSGEEAVDYLRNNSADLLVLDMIMDPGIDGLDTYKRILEFKPGQKAIIASGYSETDRVEEAQSLGAGRYIKKPYTLEKIGVTVKEELEK